MLPSVRIPESQSSGPALFPAAARGKWQMFCFEQIFCVYLSAAVQSTHGNSQGRIQSADRRSATKTEKNRSWRSDWGVLPELDFFWGVISTAWRLTMGQKSKSEGLPSKGKVEEKEEIPITIAILCYLSYAIVILFGHLRDFLRYMGWEKTKQAVEFNRPGYVPLFQSWPSFYNRNIFRRIKDGWSHVGLLIKSLKMLKS